MKRLIISIIAAASLCATAAQPRQLSLDECRRMAMDNNRDVEIARLTSDKADYTVAQTRANFFPKISAKGIYAYSDSSFDYTIKGGSLPTYIYDAAAGKYVPNVTVTGAGLPLPNMVAYMPDVEFAFETGSIYHAAAQLQQPIFMGGKIAAGYRMSLIGRELAKLNEQRTDAEAVLAADEAFWNCLRADELLATATRYQATVEEFYRSMQSAVEVGARSANDLLQVGIKQSDAELNLVKVENARRLSKMYLCHIIGLPLDSEIEVAGSLDSLSAFTANYDLTRRAEYQMLDRQVELKEEQIRLVRADFLPQVGAQASYGYTDGLRLNGDKLINRASFMGIVSVSIPIFHWGEGAAKTSAARVDKAIAELQRDDLREKMRLEVERALNTYEEAKLKVELDSRALASAEEAMRVVGDRYEHGLETLASLLESQTEWQKATTDLVDSKVALRMAESSYLKTVGLLVEPTAERDDDDKVR